MFVLYLLRSKKYSPKILQEFTIYFSRNFNHFASFNPDIESFYPKAILHKIEFGDLSLTPAYRNLIKNG